MRLLILLIFFTLPLAIFSQWRIKYDGTNLNNDIKSVSFITPSTGYLASEDWIGFSTDSGRTIQRRDITMSNIDFSSYSVNLLFGFSIEDIHAFSTDTLIVSGDFGFEPSILYSTDGGATWLVVAHRPIPFNTVNLFNSMWRLEFTGRGSTGFAIHGDQVLRTTNRGQTWQTVLQATNAELHYISFVNSQTGFVAGPNKLVKTQNGGSSWSIINTPFSIRQIAAYSEQYIFINATTGDSYYSSNGGSNWIQTNSPAAQISASDMHYVNDSTGFIANGGIYQTRNRGKSWELMSVSGEASPMRLHFWNDQLAWAASDGEKLHITTNRGGIAHPRALFTYDGSAACNNGTVQLINQSHAGYSYQWLRNNVPFSNSYNTSYNAGTSPETIKLVVSNGIENDTMAQLIDAVASTNLTINSAVRQDTVCSNSVLLIDIFNSRTDVLYQVGRNCCGYFPEVYGNGGTLTLSAHTNSTEDSSSTFTVFASVNGACGRQVTSVQHRVHIIQSFPPTTALKDTVCTQAPFMITIPNSREGYLYWADTSFAKVSGTGGTIQLPCRVQMATSSYNLTMDWKLMRYTIPVYVQHARFGCGGEWYITEATIIGREAIAYYEVLGYEWLTGSNLSFLNKSKYATTYQWRFPGTSGNTQTTGFEPTNIGFTTNGVKPITLFAQTKEGCIDSSTRLIEIYNNLEQVPTETICPGTNVVVVDSLRGNRQYFVSRSIYEDQSGNRVVAGAYTDMRAPGSFYPSGFEGWFAVKYDKNGNQLWSLRQSTGDDYYTYNPNSHIIVEQAITDSRGYTYLFGHSLNRKNITANNTDLFPIERAGAFLMQISPSGRILWVRNFYNRQSFSTDISLNYSGGSILKGKDDDIYVITHRDPGGRLFMNNTQLLNYGEGYTGAIVQLDKSGNIKRFRNFPILQNNMRRYNSGTNSYDSLAHAQWGPNGEIVVYGLLNPQEMQGNNIDGIPVTFNVNTIRQSLLFFDTSSLRVNAIKPLYFNSSSGPAGIPLQSFAVDNDGRYYAGFSTRVPLPLGIPSDNVNKPKSYIACFENSGILRWMKQAEGLEPKAMFVTGEKLKIAGTNYALNYFSNGSLIQSSQQSPTLHAVKKLTIIGNPGELAGTGIYGLGSIDLTLATLNSSTGDVLKLQTIGSAKEDESVAFNKGFGEQMWMAGTVGFTYRNVTTVPDTTSTTYTYKIAIDNNCTSTYETMRPFLNLDIRRDENFCTDSTYNIYWSSHNTGLLNISYSSNNGISYTTLQNGISAPDGQLLFNARQNNASGKLLFRIEDASSSLWDTAGVSLTLKVTPEISITSSTTFSCPDSSIRFSAIAANTGTNPRYEWYINKQRVSAAGPTYTRSTFPDGAQVYAVLTSNISCLTAPTDTSNTITIYVAPRVTPFIAISGITNLLYGQQTSITTTVINGGTNPVFEWQDSTASHDWRTIAGATSAEYQYKPLANGDKIRCTLTSSTPCALPASVTSTALSFNVNMVTGVPTIPGSEFGIRLYPNPASTAIIIDTLSYSEKWETIDIISVEGKQPIKQKNVRNVQRAEIDISNLPSGFYIAVLHRKDKPRVYIRFLKL